MKKLPSHITNEELLAALESADEVESTNWENDVPHFLSKFKLDQGKFKVGSALLYKLYKLYSKAAVSRLTLTVSASQFIPYDGKHFLVNIPAMKIAKVVHTGRQERKVNFNANDNIKKHYEQFVRVRRLSRGTTWVEGVLFHEIYRFYCIDTKQKSRLNYQNFTTVSKMYFKDKRIGSSKGYWYAIDGEAISRLLTPDDIDRLNARRRVVSEKTRAKTSRALKGKERPKLTEEHKNNLRLAGLADWAKRREKRDREEEIKKSEFNVSSVIAAPQSED